MAEAAVEEVVAEEGEKKPKSPIVLIIVGVVGLLIILASTVAGTLFLTGFFNPKPDPELAEAAADGHGKDGKGKDGKDAKPGKKTKESPELTRFEYSYLQIEREFLVNLSGSKKVMSVQLAVMTHYDERVFENVKKHEFAIRSGILDVMRQTTEAEASRPDFRSELSAKIKVVMNDILKKYEDFGGIEDVFFTSFVMQ